jgi:hypothetical protein
MSYYSKFAKLEKMKSRLARDQRKTPREEIIIKVLSSKLEERAAVQNINMFGAFIATHKMLKVGESLDLKFFLESNHSVEFQGVVVRKENGTDQFGIGVEFKDFNQTNFDELLTFVLSGETKTI